MPPILHCGKERTYTINLYCPQLLYFKLDDKYNLELIYSKQPI